MCTNQSSFIAPPPPALPTLLHYYCTTFAQYTTPLRPPLCMPYTIQYWAWQYRAKANLRLLSPLFYRYPELLVVNQLAPSHLISSTSCSCIVDATNLDVLSLLRHYLTCALAALLALPGISLVNLAPHFYY